MLFVILVKHCLTTGVFQMPANIQHPSVLVLPDGRLDAKNAATYLGLSVKTLAIKRSHGTGPKFVKQGRVFYFVKDLDAWLNQGAATSTAQARLTAA
ncbi:MAG: helix-turn-helix domain-containing protein [Candidatus Accumulibacter sp.]|nr:helix-turn-helix domain-containing protein [Accumulibacter sp.]